MESQLADGSFADLGPSEMKVASGYRVLDRETVSDTERIITLYMDGDRNIVILTLENTPDGWHVSGQDNSN